VFFVSTAELPFNLVKPLASYSNDASEALVRITVCGPQCHVRAYYVNGQEYRTLDGVRDNAKAIYKIDMIAQGYMGRPK